MPSNKKSRKNKSSSSDAAQTEPSADTTIAQAMSAKQARKAEKAARKAAEEAARAAADAEKAAAKAAAKADKQSDKQSDKDAKRAAKAEKKRAAQQDAAAPTFKHVRKKKLSSGKGPSPQEIGESLVALFNAGKSDEAESTWYHRKIESIEDDGSVFEGWKGVLEKGKWWKENFTVLSMRAAGPFVCSTGFTVVYTGRVRMPDGTEADAHECGVYTVEKGRIVREQFMKACF